MAGIDHSPPPFFKRGPAPLALLSLYLGLSISLMVLDHKFHYLEWVRQGVAVFTTPLQMLAHAPSKGFSQVDEYFASLISLQKENDQLKHTQLEAATILQRHQLLEAENRHLRELLGVKERLPTGGQLAQILYAARDPFSRRVIVDKGMQDALKNGVIAGFPLVDVKAKLIFGSYHEVDSSEQAFYVAGSMAMKEACRSAAPVLLEPIMSVEVVTPEEYLGDVMGDLNSRRGKVSGMEARANSQAVRCHVPLSNMFGYATDLRSKTQGRATFTMQCDHYERVPQNLAEELIKKSA